MTFCFCNRYTTYQLLISNQGLLLMNQLERRRLVKAQVIDVKIAKAAVNASKRQRAEAVKVLRKDMAAKHFAQLRAAS
jgi:hypothetical protein